MPLFYLHAQFNPYSDRSVSHSAFHFTYTDRYYLSVYVKWNVHVCTVTIDSSYKRKDKDICYHRKKLIILSSLHVLSYGNIYSKYHTKLPFGGNKYRKTLNVRGIISEDIF